MKARLLFPILGLMLLVSACSEQSQVNEPISTAPGAAAKIAQLNLTMDQTAFVDEMYYMEEDMSVLLGPTSYDALRDIAAGPGDRRDVRGFVDMAAIVYYNLILKAIPDLDPSLLEQIRNLIANSNETRAKIIADGLAAGKTREEIAAELLAEHDKLMGLINEIITPEGVAAIEAYKLKLQEERERLRQEMIALRIDREVLIMTQQLGLNEQQAADVRAALVWQQEQIAALRLQFKDNPEGFRAALQELLAQMEQRMIAAMGEELWQQWKDLRSGRTGGGDTRDPILEQVKHMTELLGLDARQQAELTKILTDQQNQIKALVQKYGSDRRGLAQALKELQNRTNEAIKGLLTPEQLELWLKYQRGGIRPGEGGGMGGGRTGG
ncbi:MAG: hypothetical protein IH600_17740 [Bacteroidetes bacterium]|nr:hypothetical protein [Bacteroidota bacterium]